ncbi:glycosyltransferase family 2 protein [Cognatitamlana onchidii]|uniref:glycosyltransferase family 2 protein n=1 Tax=Cognatitamlana onchidii TaxID=2562860 RepID=UPI0010A5AD42|nr:glycosyltransferase family 2 protein [Algibacter onchidii]
MQDQFLISIIIPTYNRAHLIGETLDSILAQTHSNWECIVIDDGSNDNTVEVLNGYRKKDARFKYYHRPKNRLPGGNAARNYGFEKSIGEYIKWFDSDDLMVPTILEQQLEGLIIKNKGISVCLFDRFSSDFKTIEKEAKPNRIRCNAYYDFITRRLKVNLQTTMWKRSIVANIKLDETLTKSQEYDFIQRVLKNNYDDVVLLNKSLIKVRRHNNSITGAYFNQEPSKVKSSMEVKLRVLKDINVLTPRLVKKKLENIYFKALLKVFKFKESRILYYYLFKAYRLKEFELKRILLKIALIYPVYLLTGKGLVYLYKLININSKSYENVSTDNIDL